jgi:hypothetical protein
LAALLLVVTYHRHPTHIKVRALPKPRRDEPQYSTLNRVGGSVEFSADQVGEPLQETDQALSRNRWGFFYVWTGQDPLIGLCTGSVVASRGYGMKP